MKNVYTLSCITMYLCSLISPLLIAQAKPDAINSPTYNRLHQNLTSTNTPITTPSIIQPQPQDPNCYQTVKGTLQTYKEDCCNPLPMCNDWWNDFTNETGSDCIMHRFKDRHPNIHCCRKITNYTCLTCCALGLCATGIFAGHYK